MSRQLFTYKVLRSKIIAHIYRTIGRPRKNAETFKARKRRIREKFFEKYCKGKGLDIGYGGDLLCDNCEGFDYENGDAQYMVGLDDNAYDFVYSSHTLEHMQDPVEALRNWFRLVKSNGYLILYVPHRDLYEKKIFLPSNWNPDHNFYFLPTETLNDYTLGIQPLIENNLKDFKIIYLKVCNENHTITDPGLHSDGEYSIETVIKKL